jgi:hypothetical protein
MMIFGKANHQVETSKMGSLNRHLLLADAIHMVKLL